MSLERFVQAQEEESSYDRALAELEAGRKSGHWIWWVFPQLKGLGTSSNTTFYGLTDEAEARAYLAHPILGVRYRECVAILHGHVCAGRVSPLDLMGCEIDMLKLCSSLELFLKVADEVLARHIVEILEALAAKGVGNLELFVDSSKRSQDLYLKDFEARDAERLLSGGHVLLAGGCGSGKTLLIRSKLLPLLHSRGAHVVVCDYHGDYTQDLPNQRLKHGFEDDESLSEELKRNVAKAFDASAVISEDEPIGRLWGRFMALLFAEVLAGRGPKSEWYLVIDLSSDTFRMPSLLEFIPLAKKYGCTLIITAQRLVEFKPYLFSDITFLAQYSGWYENSLIILSGRPRGLIHMQAEVLKNRIDNLNPLQFICFYMGGSSQGYRLHRTPGYGTGNDPVLPAPS